jgi:hypothetical protein
MTNIVSLNSILIPKRKCCDEKGEIIHNLLIIEVLITVKKSAGSEHPAPENAMDARALDLQRNANSHVIGGGARVSRGAPSSTV